VTPDPQRPGTEGGAGPRRAVIVLPDDDRARSLAAAAQHVFDRGYELLAIAPAPVALRMLADGLADVVVAAAAAEHLSVEFADWPLRRVPRPRAAPDDSIPPTRRRPRPIG